MPRTAAERTRASMAENAPDDRPAPYQFPARPSVVSRGEPRFGWQLERELQSETATLGSQRDPPSAFRDECPNHAAGQGTGHPPKPGPLDGPRLGAHNIHTRQGLPGTLVRVRAGPYVTASDHPQERPNQGTIPQSRALLPAHSDRPYSGQ